jgi:hypothetical protein
MRYLSVLVPGAALALLAAEPAPSTKPTAPRVAPAEKPAKPKHSLPTAFPGGVLDVTGRTAFVAGADGALEALDLLTGDVVWKTHEAQVPLLVVGDRLIAQAGVKRNRMRLLTLDIKHKGEVLSESDPVVFPRWVVTGDSPGHTFEARWRLEGRKAVINWTASAWAESVDSSTHREPSTRKEGDGSARIDLETGSVETGPAEQVPPSPTAQLPRQLQKQAVRWSRLIDRHLLALVLIDADPSAKIAPTSDFHSTKDGGEVPWGPKKPGTRDDAVRVPKPREYILRLHAWDWLTGKPMPPRDLIRGRRPTVLPTLDNEYLLLHDAGAAPDEMVSSTTAEQRAWDIVAVMTLQSAGKLPFVAGAHSPMVIDNRVYYLVAGPITGPLDRPAVRSQNLQVYDLATKKVLWERPIAGKALHPPGQ